MTEAQPSAPSVGVNGLTKTYAGRTVLDGIDFEISKGECVCVIGPSGSGKSTLLRCIAQLEQIDGGVIAIDGEPVGYELRAGRLVALGNAAIRRQRTRIGMVFQQFNLFPHLTALQNVTEGPRRTRGLRRADAEREGRELLARVGIGDRADSYPAQLSGGQQQRVAIARALAMQPEIMLFDEPTSALDPELVGEVLSVMQELALSGMTMIVVTHEIGFAREVADRIVVMDDGRIIEQGEASALLDAPRTRRAREFLAAVLG